MSQLDSKEKFPDQSENELKILARNLEGHVKVLAEKIGERPIYNKLALEKSRDYIIGEWKKMGIIPIVLSYTTSNLSYASERNVFQNIEVRLNQGNSASDGELVIGAHYDTAPGTKGADDNASGVAVLLELTRLLKDAELKRPVRLVAFCTEEPPSFGTENMGSFQYARNLKEQGFAIRGMISLEMVGFFTDNPNSQSYPSLLKWFYPDRGNFISFASNWKSRPFLREFKKRWKKVSPFPLETISAPGSFGGIGLSDHMNFWKNGFHAFMVTDTAFMRNPHYHQSTDTFEKLDYLKMGRITNTLSRIIATF